MRNAQKHSLDGMFMMRWAGHVARVGEMTYAYKILFWREEATLDDLIVDGTINWIGSWRNGLEGCRLD